MILRPADAGEPRPDAGEALAACHAAQLACEGPVARRRAAQPLPVDAVAALQGSCARRAAPAGVAQAVRRRPPPTAAAAAAAAAVLPGPERRSETCDSTKTASLKTSRVWSMKRRRALDNEIPH